MMHRNAIHILLLTVLGLSFLGLVMLSSTAAYAYESRGDIYYFLKRQGLWLAISLGVAFVAGALDYRIWVRVWPWALGLTMVLLVLCFVPPVGFRINGSNRWVHFGFVTFQPSEMAKVCAVVILAWWYSGKQREVHNFWHGIGVPVLFLAGLTLPIFLEVDLGTTALIWTTGFLIMFLAGAPLKWLCVLGGAGVLGGIFAIWKMPERVMRVLAFLEPEKHRLGEGLQQWQALIAFGSGGVDGLGLGQGRQKLLYLPYAHTDFIFPMVGEELGLKFTLVTVLAYLVICLCGIQVALMARDRFGSFLAFGSTVILTVQAAVNIGVTTSLLPNKGIPLPFISFGGSNLLVCWFLVGLLVSIHRHGRVLMNLESPVLRQRPIYCRI